MRRRRMVATIGAVLGSGLAGCSDSGGSGERAFAVSSPPLESEETLPARFTCEGAGESPPFDIQRVPDPTAALAVVAEYDRGPFEEPVFWSLWNVPPETERIPAGLGRTPTVDALGGARQGRQPGGDVGYEPPCPPAGQAYSHRFQVYALSESLAVEGGAEHEPATEAIGNAVLASRLFAVEYTGPSTA